MLRKLPKLKLYDREGNYRASFKFAEDAAALVALYEGGTIRHNHRLIVWTEGSEYQSAADSYDFAAETMNLRIGGKCGKVGANNHGGRVLCGLVLKPGAKDHAGDHFGDPL